MEQRREALVAGSRPPVRYNRSVPLTRRASFLLATSLTLCGAGPFVPAQDVPALPRVLIIGDSISIGYTPSVRKLLKGEANLHRIPENGGSSSNGVEKLGQWLGAGKWDVIHFNFGLHDLKLMEDGNHQVPLARYEQNLRAIAATLKATGATLIFATTTPVPEGKLEPPRRPADVAAFNATALRVMEENGISIDDLYSLALPRLDEIQRPANVHFTDAGSAALAAHVAHAITAALKAR